MSALVANRMRSSLTMFGMVIGVAAVVVLVALGTGTKNMVEAQVEGLGSNLLIVVPGQVNFNAAPAVSRMDNQDLDAMIKVVGDRERITATLTSGETVRAGNQSTFTTVNGVMESTPKVFLRGLRTGSYLSRTDVDTGRRVAVLGSLVAQRLFGERDAVGQQITIAGVRFRVIGVFAPLGQSLGVDRDNEVHIPLTTAQRLLGTGRVDAFAVKAPDRDTIDRLGDELLAELKRRHPDSEFSAVTQEQILGVLGSATSSASSPPCWPRSPASRCSWAASASPTSCWSRCASGPRRSGCARRWGRAPATSACSSCSRRSC
jgi:putative ABC transport system permease protein